MSVYKKGNNWYIDYYVKGQRKRKKIGPSKKLALQVLEDVHVKLVKGEFLGVYEEKKVQFKEYSKKYLEYCKANKATTSYKRDVTSINALTAVFGSYYLYEIEPLMVESYKAKRLQDGVEPASVNREVACLKHMYNMAVEWDYVKTNPIAGVKMLKEPPGRIRYLETSEIDGLLRAVDSLKRGCSQYLRPIVILALNTGLRKNEILQLKWKHVDLKDRKITVTRSKNNEIRTVPINDTLYVELARLSRHPESEYVFCDNDGVPFGNVRKSFDGALKLAKIEDFHFHDLRHTFASHLVMRGCDLRTVQQLMGHKEIKMTMRYSHLSKAHLQEAVSRLDALWTPCGHQAANGDGAKSLTH